MENLRYSRQIIMPQIGSSGQEALQSSRVLVVGAGGIGSTVALYLAASGVPTDVLDFDRVEVSNLHRQIIHDESQAGREKAISAAEHMRRINSTVPVNSLVSKLTAENAEEIITKYDLVVDATDNIEARYLINDCCVLLRKPLVSGSAVSMDGQITTIIPYTTPCYRCLYPSLSTTMGGCRSCADAGVLGPIPGLIGCLQAIEVMKLLLNKDRYMSSSDSTDVSGAERAVGKRSSSTVPAEGEVQTKRVKNNGKSAAQLKPLLGRQVLYDAVSGEFHTFQLPPRRAECAVCGERPTIRSMQDSAASLQAAPTCKISAPTTTSCPNVSSSSSSASLIANTPPPLPPAVSLPLSAEHRISARDFSQAIQSDPVSLILDVRSAEQFSMLHLVRPGLSSYDSVREAQAALQDSALPGAATAVQVNLPLSQLRGGKVASEREANQHSVFGALKKLLNVLGTAAAAAAPAPAGSAPPRVFVLCRRGVDSVTATQLLLEAVQAEHLGKPGSVGALTLLNVDGGLTAWSTDVDTSMVMY